MQFPLVLVLFVFISCDLKKVEITLKNNSFNVIQSNAIKVIGDSSKKAFKEVLKCPNINDSSKFIADLIKTYSLEVEGNIRRISDFKKVNIIGSNDTFYFIQLEYNGKTGILFPWKYQLIFNKEGNNIFIGSHIKYEFKKIFKDQNPLYVVYGPTSKGNGGYNLYKVKGENLIDILEWNSENFPKSYDAHESDESYNTPPALNLIVKNNSNPVEIIFKGKVLIMRKGKADCETPCGSFIAEMRFKFDSLIGKFFATEDYTQKYKRMLQ